jgi:3-phosphoshikimate 1-carboxyvinyltransferase
MKPGGQIRQKFVHDHSLPCQDSDDIRYMVGALKVLGIKLEERWEKGEMVVTGCGGRFPSMGAELFLGNAGTAMRPLTAAVAAAGRGK